MIRFMSFIQEYAMEKQEETVRLRKLLSKKVFFQSLNANDDNDGDS
jgi:hypothetical protein